MKQGKPLPKNMVVRSPGSPVSLVRPPKYNLVPKPPCDCEKHVLGKEKGKVN